MLHHSVRKPVCTFRLASPQNSEPQFQRCVHRRKSSTHRTCTLQHSTAYIACSVGRSASGAARPRCVPRRQTRRGAARRQRKACPVPCPMRRAQSLLTFIFQGCQERSSVGPPFLLQVMSQTGGKDTAQQTRARLQAFKAHARPKLHIHCGYSGLNRGRAYQASSPGWVLCQGKSASLCAGPMCAAASCSTSYL